MKRRSAESLCATYKFSPLSDGRRDFGVLRCDDDYSGDVLLSSAFQALDPLCRADALQEVIALLEREYDRALMEMRNQHDAIRSAG